MVGAGGIVEVRRVVSAVISISLGAVLEDGDVLRGEAEIFEVGGGELNEFAAVLGDMLENELGTALVIIAAGEIDLVRGGFAGMAEGDIFETLENHGSAK